MNMGATLKLVWACTPPQAGPTWAPDGVGRALWDSEAEGTEAGDE